MSDSKKKSSKENSNNNEKKSNKKKIIGWIIFLCLLGLGAQIGINYLYNDSAEVNNAQTNQLVKQDTLLKQDTSTPTNAKFMAAVSDTTSDTSSTVVYVSRPEDVGEANFTMDQSAGKSIKRVFTGKRINIAVTGVDSRLGTSTKHADANHILSILPDQGIIEITSIPRDTPAEAGQTDSSGQNKLTIVRALKGREAYLKEAARIAGLDKIHYWVEAGFSQVMGILNLLGFKDPGSALQVLRSRTALGGDDYQRCYNQGQFIRQSTLSHFNKFTGVLGELAIRGGLAFVETNLTTDIIKDIISKLQAKNFPSNPDVVTLRVRPAMGRSFKIYDFTDNSTFVSLKSKIESVNSNKGLDSVKVVVNVAGKLNNFVNKAIQDSAKRPQNVITGLVTYYNQKAWHQVKDEAQRNKLRDQIGLLLANAYDKKKQPDKAKAVRIAIADEKELFSKQLFDKPKSTKVK